MRDLDIVTRSAALVADFGKGYSRPEQKFLQDVVFGILRSRSCLLSEIARAIGEGKNIRTVLKRLDFNLGRYDLSKAYERAQSRMLRQVDENYLFIFDPSEIVKPFAKKMEGLCRVRDASEKPRHIYTRVGKSVETPVLKPGYPVRVAVALSSDGDVLPIELSLYSTGSETFASANDEYVQVLETLVHKTNFLPTLVLDREFDAYAIIRHLCLLRQKFIIRVTQNRKYYAADARRGDRTPTFTREEIIDKKATIFTKTKFVYTRQGETKEMTFKISCAHVQLLSEDKKKETFRDRGDEQALSLVRVKIEKDTGTPTLYLLTNTRPKTGDDLEKAARSYLARWNIEEYIRFIKQHFEIESFLVRDLGRMKNLISAVYIATVLVHILTDRSSLRGLRTHQHLLDRSLEVGSKKRFRDFHLYAYGRALSRLVRINKSLLKSTNNRSKPSKNSQLSFSIPDLFI